MLSCRSLSLLSFAAVTISGCANVTAPSGGKKDITPPRLVRVSPADSMRNSRIERVELSFDEFITVNDAGKEVTISPTLAIDPTVTGLNRKVTIKLVDTLLEDNTTYRISLGSAVRDLHEGNAFKNYTYSFSTGSYFDSLSLRGTVIDAGTGTSAGEGILVGLFDVRENDSATVRHKPKYVAKTDANGSFELKGLPGRTYRLYAVKDANSNLTYDGPEKNEMIAFHDAEVIPGIDSAIRPVQLRLFTEKIDSPTQLDGDFGRGKKALSARPKERKLTYSTNIDSSDASKRTFDVNKRIEVTMNDRFIANYDRITLLMDSAGTSYPAPHTITADSTHLHIQPLHWSTDKVYTLKLAKGFAKDTAEAEFPPSRYTFRTWDESNYGTIKMHLASRFYNSGGKYIFRAIVDNDTAYLKPVTDTVFTIARLKPGAYTMAIIVDSNLNGHWDTGDLFAKKQPEEVIPYEGKLMLKPGWENVIDFAPQVSDKGGLKRKASMK